MEVTIRRFITFPQQQKYMFPFQSLEKLAYYHLCYELAITISASTMSILIRVLMLHQNLLSIIKVQFFPL